LAPSLAEWFKARSI